MDEWIGTVIKFACFGSFDFILLMKCQLLAKLVSFFVHCHSSLYEQDCVFTLFIFVAKLPVLTLVAYI